MEEMDEVDKDKAEDMDEVDKDKAEDMDDGHFRNEDIPCFRSALHSFLDNHSCHIS
jgi:hypothetical protein